MEVEENKDLQEINKIETEAGESEGKPEKKRKLHKYFRTHAHRNPLSDGNFEVPLSPSHAQWDHLYPAYFKPGSTPDQWTHKIVHADVGCGYGGLLEALGKLYPDKLSLGIEIRSKVVEYVEQRIEKLRAKHANEVVNYQNCAVFNTNAMKFLPNYFFKGQLEKIFFLFPDPHFKAKCHRRRIINSTLLAEYAYVLAVGGKIYTISDVLELHQWMVSFV